ncbi:hypothetical protein FACS1894137_05010 [Spirochaetia bacterium]|nr:hypothetical protein FACS1894137_05010 [Spirochaetia bacterium]
MKLEKQTYFQVLEDDIVYKAHKEKIDTFIQEELEKEEALKKDREENNSSGALSQLEIDNLLCAVREPFSSPKEVEISDVEYEELKKHSELLDKYERDMDRLACSFESYRDKYEKTKQKNCKLQRIVERLMENDHIGIERKLSILLEVLL